MTSVMPSCLGRRSSIPVSQSVDNTTTNTTTTTNTNKNMILTSSSSSSSTIDKDNLQKLQQPKQLQQLDHERLTCLTEFTSSLGYHTLGNGYGLSLSPYSSSSSSSLSSATQQHRPTPSDTSSSSNDTATAIATQRIKRTSGGGPTAAVLFSGGGGISLKRRRDGTMGGVGVGNSRTTTDDGGSSFSHPHDKLQRRTSPITDCLYKDADDPIGGAVCSFPSMDAKDFMEGGSRNGVGGSGGGDEAEDCEERKRRRRRVPSPPPPVESIGGDGNDDGVSTDAANVSDNANDGTKTVPNMAASIVDLPPSSTPTPTSTSTTATPGNATDTTPTRDEIILSTSLSEPTIWTRSSVSQAPPALLRSLASSFSSLVDSRVRAWTLFLLRHSLSSSAPVAGSSGGSGGKRRRGGEKDAAARSQLLNMLETRNRIEVIAAVTDIKVTKKETTEGKVEKEDAKEEETKGKNDTKEEEKVKDDTKEEKEVRNENDEKARATEETVGMKNGIGRKTDDCQLVLPVTFEAVLDVGLRGKEVTVRFGASGTIAANFHENTSSITYALLKLDTLQLAKRMIEQTSRVVFEAVAHATSTPSPPGRLSRFLISESRPAPLTTNNNDHPSTSNNSLSVLHGDSSQSLRKSSFMPNAASTPDFCGLGRGISGGMNSSSSLRASQDRTRSLFLELQRLRMGLKERSEKEGGTTKQYYPQQREDKHTTTLTNTTNTNNNTNTTTTNNNNNNNPVDQKQMLETRLKKVRESNLKLSSFLTSPINMPSTGSTAAASTNSKNFKSFNNSNSPGLSEKRKQPSVVWKDDPDGTRHATATSSAQNNSNMNNYNSLFKRPKFSLEGTGTSITTNQLGGGESKTSPPPPILKRSMKSFGRPGANDFVCVRNATFAEFGRLKDCDDGHGLGLPSKRPEALREARLRELMGTSSSSLSRKAGIGTSMGVLGGFGEEQGGLGIKRSGGSRAAVPSTGDGGSVVGSTTTAIGIGNSKYGNATFDRSQYASAMNPAGSGLSLGELRSRKSAQFEKMLSMVQQRQGDGSNGGGGGGGGTLWR